MANFDKTLVKILKMPQNQPHDSNSKKFLSGQISKLLNDLNFKTAKIVKNSSMVKMCQVLKALNFKYIQKELTLPIVVKSGQN